MDVEEINPVGLKEKLMKDLGATHVDVHDTSGGCGQSFEAVIVSTQFEGKRLLDRHRLVHQCLAEELKHIHAFTQKTYTPEQWAKT